MNKLFEYLEQEYSQSPRDYFKILWWQENYTFEHSFDCIRTGQLESQRVIDASSIEELERKALEYLQDL